MSWVRETEAENGGNVKEVIDLQKDGGPEV